MSRSTLKFLAVFLGVLIVVVFFSGLDGLPRSLRAEIGKERTVLASSEKQLHAAQDEVLAGLKSESELFHAIPASQQWPDQLSKALGDFQLASREMEQLATLDKQNRRQDRQRVEALLSHERNLRTAALNDATGIQKEAAHWLDLKRHLPEAVQQMERDYNTIHGIDLGPVIATVQRTENDWPEKKPDLDARLGRVSAGIAQADSLWQSSAEMRRLAAANDLAHLDLVALVAATDTLKTSARLLPGQTAELTALSGQVYNAWDKILVDMEVRSGNQYEQKIRTVQTHLADASAKTGEVTSNEKWVDVSKAAYEAEKNDLGMAIEHKSAGKYDVEAERVAQPAGFAYVAPPSQGSNQYGYWDHSGGRDFWVFYGQYALMRDLLFNNRYEPVYRGDWESYRTYHSRGQTYYGGGTATSQSAPKYGTQGTATQERYSGSSFSKSGGFRDSKYATKSGSYNDSKYATPGGDRTPKQFGNGSSRQEQPRAAPSSRPQPRPTYRAPSAPRRFGKR